jgi:hypothetical protein
MMDKTGESALDDRGNTGESASSDPDKNDRRHLLRVASAAVAGLAAIAVTSGAASSSERAVEKLVGQSNGRPMPMPISDSDEVLKEKIRRACLAGPSVITREATVAEFDQHDGLTVLRKGTNQWVCVPGNENVVGRVDMCLDPMGMQWMMDVMARKPKPTNAAPGLIYMLNGATQRSTTDPFDKTGPAIPIGPHWMILWPFDAAAAGLPSMMRDAGTMVMFAGTPYAHLHICGSPWDGNEYHPGDRAVRTLTYLRTVPAQ